MACKDTDDELEGFKQSGGSDNELNSEHGNNDEEEEEEEENDLAKVVNNPCALLEKLNAEVS